MLDSKIVHAIGGEKSIEETMPNTMASSWSNNTVNYSDL